MIPQKKHIAIFGIKYFPSRGGTSRVVESLLRHIHDEYRITIYCYKHPQAETNIPSIETVQFEEPKIKKLGVFIFFTKCLWHLLVRSHYDLVHVHKTEASYFIPFIRLKYPVIATSHEIPYLNNKWGFIGRIYFRIAEWLFMYTTAQRTSISQTQCDFYKAKYNRSVKYIPNGVSKPVLCSEREIKEFLEKHDIQGDYLFFAARRIIPLKGCHYFIEALTQLNYQGQVVIAGDLSQMPEYTEKLLDQSSGLRIKFVDYIASPELLNHVARFAKIFIFPSEIEGMSMMLLEVAILGTPIICSDIPQNQVIFGDQHVLYFRSKDPKDLADKIKYALSHENELVAMSLQARTHAIEHFGIEQAVDKYQQLYNEQLNLKTHHELT